MEYARNVLVIKGATHEEIDPQAPTLVISRLASSLVGKTEPVRIAAGSLAFEAYGQEQAAEQFSCNFGLNPGFDRSRDWGRLKITGVGPAGEARIVELEGHPFYVATLFLPQMSSKPDRPHPLIEAFLKAAMAGEKGSGAFFRNVICK